MIVPVFSLGSGFFWGIVRGIVVIFEGMENIGFGTGIVCECYHFVNLICWCVVVVLFCLYSYSTTPI